ncbi:hypothetical protein ACN677_07690 [Lactiplantibacillus paraplantarum]|uniref:hypothetical protein n=1 Tax=Lactiplantibacillus paraplantarum TaxID=60520 RepID=UPI003B27B5AA
MKDHQEIQIRLVLASILTNDQRIISFHTTRKSESAYVLLGNNQGEFLAIRLSTHKAFSVFMSIPTFDYTDKVQLTEKLSDFLRRASWLQFNYHDYFALSMIVFAKQHGTEFQIDDSYTIFSEASQGMVFYQLLGRPRGKQVVLHAFEEDYNRVLRRLYAQALIASHSTDNTFKLYVTEAGIHLLDWFSTTYIETFANDYLNVNWFDLKLPKQSADEISK